MTKRNIWYNICNIGEVFIVEIDERAIAKFKDYLENYARSLKRAISKCESFIDNGQSIIDFKKRPTVDNLLQMRPILSTIDDEIADQIKVINYFVENGVSDIEQVSIAIDKILSSKALDNYLDDLPNQENLRERQVDELERVKPLIEGDDYDFVYMNDLLSQSKLSDEEQIAVLLNETLKRCPKRVDQAEISVDVASLIGEEEGKRDDVRTLYANYREISDKLNETISKNYRYVEGKNEEQIKAAKAIVDAIKEARRDNVDFNLDDYNYLDMRMLVYVVELIEMRDALEKEFERDKPNYDDVSLYMMELGDVMGEIDETMVELEKDEREENGSPSKVVFFLDDDGNPLFDTSAFKTDDNKRVKMLLDKLENGFYDYDNKTSHAKVRMAKKTDYHVYCKKSGQMACTYIRVNDDTILLLDIDSATKIYDNAKHIVDKYDDSIKKRLGDIRNNDERVLTASAAFAESFASNLNSEKGVTLS